LSNVAAVKMYSCIAQNLNILCRFPNWIIFINVQWCGSLGEQKHEEYRLQRHDKENAASAITCL